MSTSLAAPENQVASLESQMIHPIQYVRGQTLRLMPLLESGLYAAAPFTAIVFIQPEPRFRLALFSAIDMLLRGSRTMAPVVKTDGLVDCRGRSGGDCGPFR
jgi:hypothetical protein